MAHAMAPDRAAARAAAQHQFRHARQSRRSTNCATERSADRPLAQDGPQAGSFLLTIFLKHDESKTLDQINAQLKAQGFDKAFPPEGTQVVSGEEAHAKALVQ